MARQHSNITKTVTESSIEFRSEPLDSWADFKTFVSASIVPDRDRYLFRGQGDECWKLESSFDRKFKSLNDGDRDDRHKGLLEYFKRECQHYPEYKSQTEDEVQLMALAQHHRLPTRLLDWTESPYVAAYFAFRSHLEIDHGLNNSGKANRVAIWILDKDARGYWGGSSGVTIIEPIAWHNERQKRQDGWFTHARIPFRTLEEYVLKMGNEGKALRKLTIPASEAASALVDLGMMRINARELFADLDGAAINALMHAVLVDELI